MTDTFHAEDPDEEELYYWIDWGDGNNSGWLGPYPSGITIERTYNWSKKGTYTINQAKAKDPYKKESDWGSQSVSMSRSKVTNRPALRWKLSESMDWMVNTSPAAGE